MRKLTNIINGIYLVIVLFFLIDSLTSFDIKKQLIKSVVYFGFLFGAPLLLLWNLLVHQKPVEKTVGIIYPAVFLITALWIGPINILRASGAWRTQTILYQHGHLRFLSIEFQMQDIGGLGYQKRTVQVTYITPLFTISSPIPENIDNNIEWIKVDIDVNELQLKFP